jgi:uncharacterized protein (TIRG00374 family)
VVSLSLIGFLIHKTGFGSIARTVRTADQGWLAAGFALGLVAAGLQAYQWRGLLAAMGLRRTYRSTLQLDTAARVFDAALPTSIGGDVVRVGLASTAAAERVPSALSVVLRRVLQLPGLVTVLLVGIAASWGLPYGGKVRTVAGIFALAGLALIAVVALTTKVKRLRDIPLPRKVRRFVSEWRLATEEAVSEGHPFVRAAVRGLLFWTVVVLSQTCYMLAVGIHPPLGYATLVVATVNAVSLLPISLGGYGLREGTFSAFLAVGGLATAAQGASVGACLSIQTFIFGLVGGVVYLTMRRPGRASEIEAEAADGSAALHEAELAALSGSASEQQQSGLAS